MNISAETQSLMSELDDFSGSKLKNITDLSSINEIAVISGKAKLYYDLQFSAKYVNGLSKILQDNLAGISIPNPKADEPAESKDEAAEKIKKEFKTNILRFTELLKDLLKHADDYTRKVFEEKYLALTRDSMLNLIPGL
jgi:hypothetical protein